MSTPETQKKHCDLDKRISNILQGFQSSSTTGCFYKTYVRH